MIDYESKFIWDQRVILKALKKAGARKDGRLARRGSRVQELVERLRKSGTGLIHPKTAIANGYAVLTAHQAIARMVLVGELKQVSHGVYRLVGEVKT